MEELPLTTPVLFNYLLKHIVVIAMLANAFNSPEAEVHHRRYRPRIRC